MRIDISTNKSQKKNAQNGTKKQGWADFFLAQTVDSGSLSVTVSSCFHIL